LVYITNFNIAQHTLSLLPLAIARPSVRVRSGKHVYALVRATRNPRQAPKANTP